MHPSIENPNRAKRRLPSHVRTPRTACRVTPGNGRVGTTGTTVYRVNPDYLRRVGTTAAVARAERNARTGDTVGGAAVIARNATRRRVRTLATNPSNG